MFKFTNYFYILNNKGFVYHLKMNLIWPMFYKEQSIFNEVLVWIVNKKIFIKILTF